jgi:hypothetical protein
MRPGTAEYDALDKEELKMRTAATRAKVEKLKKNPNIFVSPTRVMIRILPSFYDEKTIKQLAKDLLSDTKQGPGAGKMFKQVKLLRDRK